MHNENFSLNKSRLQESDISIGFAKYIGTEMIGYSDGAPFISSTCVKFNSIPEKNISEIKSDANGRQH